MRGKRIETVQDFSEAMRRSRTVRLRVVEALLAGRQAAAAEVRELREVLERLLSVPVDAGRRTLAYDGKSLSFDLSYEIGELEKDLLYLSAGEAALLSRLAELHPGFASELEAGRSFLRDFRTGSPRASVARFRAFVTDRDGTINNYCGRYYSSIQSIYNALFLTRFARGRCDRAVILTSAPLEGGGLVDVSLVPPGSFVLAGSKGREAMDEAGARHRLAIPPAQRAALDRLNQELTRLLERPEFEVFGLIGSGLQFKFGQSTVAHQDVRGSIPQELSRRFRQSVEALIRRLDPDREVFRTEDTGRDLEILLTVDGAGLPPPGREAAGDEAGSAGAARPAAESLRDFDKGDGVGFLDRELGLGLSEGPTLVCGDTASDLPMVEAAVRAGGETWSIFVTRDAALSKRLRAACPRSWCTTEPDILVTLLNELGRESP